MGALLDLFYEGMTWDLEETRERWDEGFTEDAVFTNPFGEFKGQEYIDFWTALLDGFPDLDWMANVRCEIEQGDTLIFEASMVGTHTAPLRMPDGTEIPPTGRRIDVPYVLVLEARDGRFAQWRSYFDTATFQRQLTA